LSCLPTVDSKTSGKQEQKEFCMADIAKTPALKSGLSFDHLKVVPGSEHVFRIEDGEQLDGPELASAIKEIGLDKLPLQLENYLYDFLNGKAGRKRGRKAPSKTQLALYNCQMGLIYRACKMVLDGEADGEAEADADADADADAEESDGIVEFIGNHAALVAEPLSNSEKAARLTSIWYHGHSGHHRTIMNQLSSHKKHPK
jgi:hypothetical protein